MADPDALLAVARLLLQPTGGPADEARARRAVSSAYYALFHAIAGAAADRFAGPASRATAAYALLYRSFSHTQIRRICDIVKTGMLSEKYREYLGRPSVGPDIGSFARVFIVLQDARHLADYDPTGRFASLDAGALVDVAEVALQAFARVKPDEKADVLALMMVGARA